MALSFDVLRSDYLQSLMGNPHPGEGIGPVTFRARLLRAIATHWDKEGREVVDDRPFAGQRTTRESSL